MNDILSVVINNLNALINI